MPKEDTVTYSVPIPKEMDRLVQRRMKEAGFNATTEYVRSTIRADLDRAAKRKLQEKLIRAAERADYEKLTPKFWQELDKIADGESD